jgi:hypothetical protein
VILVTVAMVGAAAGVLALAVALVAHARTVRVVDECAQVIRSRLLAPADADGAASVPGARPAGDHSVAGSVAGILPGDVRAVRDLAIVHYDALKEMSGQLSFSMAMLNAAGDGVVLTSINGRTETRTYAKVVEGGRPRHPLSPEEERALRAARLGQGPRVPNIGRPGTGRFRATPSPPRPRGVV